MTVAQLIARLTKEDPNAKVITPDSVFNASEFGDEYPTVLKISTVGNYKDEDGEGLEWWMDEEPKIFNPNSIMLYME